MRAAPAVPITILDGAIGTELIARGLPAPAPAWSAWAVLHAPAELERLHRDYAAAGARVHTAATFRTTRRALGAGWERAARRAVELARAGAPGCRVAGSIAPLEDCYRPDRSPRHPGPEHRALARVLADAGADLLLCETFAHPAEACAAVEAAADTGLETWAALTAGPAADLLTPPAMARAAAACVGAGARACLVNCVPANASLAFLQAMRPLSVPLGVYANAGDAADGLGWGRGARAARRYAEQARRWIAEGATIVGGCCGTGPAHVRALAELARVDGTRP